MPNRGRTRVQSRVREAHRQALIELGDAREQALAEAERQLARLRSLVPHALRAGLSVSEIAELTGVSRQTLYNLEATRAKPADLEAALLQELALFGPLTETELLKRLDDPEAAELLAGLQAAGQVETLEVEGQAGWAASPPGVTRVTRWPLESAAGA